MTTPEQYDNQGVNIDEMMGPIPRREFVFIMRRYKVWAEGKCIEDKTCSSEVLGTFDGQTLIISNSEGVLDHIAKRDLRYPNVSASTDRLVWSKVTLTAQSVAVEDKEPEMVSLFYRTDKLVKMQLHLNSAGRLVEMFT